MIFHELKLNGACVLEPELKIDERGFFARTFCCEALSERGLCTDFVQSSISYNTRKGTLRGMHWQSEPHGEVKLVRCTAGALYDVIVDVREESPTFGKWEAVELSQANRVTLYIPRGFAHGFQTLTDDAEVFYMISEQYHPESARGFRWDDPGVGIEWPEEPTIISERDRSFDLLITDSRNDL